MGHCCFDFSNLASDTSPDDDSPTTVCILNTSALDSPNSPEVYRMQVEGGNGAKYWLLKVAKIIIFLSCQIHCLKKKNLKVY